jgi:hypothetical protein
MINWLEIEGVRYEGQGDMIHCQTAVGFHSQLPGHTLEGLEVSDAQGNPLGYLNVDFQSGHLALSPLASVSELATAQILMADDSGIHSLSLHELAPAMVDFSMLADESDYLDPVILAAPVDPQEGYSLALSSVVSEADETLDAFFGESFIHAVPSAVQPSTDVAMQLTSLYLDHGAEPLHMPLLPENPELHHLF